MAERPIKPGFYRVELFKTVWEVPEQYQDLSPIGTGAYGTVCSALDTKYNVRVALKKLARPFQSSVHALRTYRELRYLKHMKHENVIGLLDVFTPSTTFEEFQDVYLVMHLMGSDLNNIIRQQALSDDHVQFLVYQTLRGLKYVHSAGIIHRDLKPSNIAVNEDCELRILDFGLARATDNEMTGYVATRYWRAPEIMLNWMHYDEKVDMWSVGCIMAELLTGQVLFPGTDHIDQLTRILQLVGTPDQEYLSKISSDTAKTYIESMPTFPKKDFTKFFIRANPKAVEVLDRLLVMDPDRRASAAELLARPYFANYADPDDEVDKWSNAFTATIRATNGSPNIISITDYWGEYMNHDGEWVKVDEIFVGLKGNNKFFETRDFLIDSAAPSNLVVQLGIRLSDKEPDSWAERRRAHHSLPQPLHFRVTFEDQEKRTASLRFEQGNPPLDLPTRKSREDSWGKKKPLEFYIFADNVDDRKRSDAAIFYDEDGVLCYCPAPNGDSGQYFYIRQSTLNIKAFKAKKAGESEFELSDMRKEREEPSSKIAIYAMVDLDNQYVYALKVTITTATSSATGYYLLPSEDFTSATISTDPDEVLVNSEFTVNWSVPRASKTDRLEIFPIYGNSYLSSASNRQAETEGSTKMKAPGLPGEYEVRYCPKCLQGSYTGMRGDTYIAVARFTVETV